MNKVTLAFAAATAGLTLLSIHLWRQLDVEQHSSDPRRRSSTPLTKMRGRSETRCSSCAVS